MRLARRKVENKGKDYISENLLLADICQEPPSALGRKQPFATDGNRPKADAYHEEALNRGSIVTHPPTQLGRRV